VLIFPLRMDANKQQKKSITQRPQRDATKEKGTKSSFNPQMNADSFS
jgi:hypothetical protein